MSPLWLPIVLPVESGALDGPGSRMRRKKGQSPPLLLGQGDPRRAEENADERDGGRGYGGVEGGQDGIGTVMVYGDRFDE